MAAARGKLVLLVATIACFSRVTESGGVPSFSLLHVNYNVALTVDTSKPYDLAKVGTAVVLAYYLGKSNAAPNQVWTYDSQGYLVTSYGHYRLIENAKGGLEITNSTVAGFKFGDWLISNGNKCLTLDKQVASWLSSKPCYSKNQNQNWYKVNTVASSGFWQK